MKTTSVLPGGICKKSKQKFCKHTEQYRVLHYDSVELIQGMYDCLTFKD